MSSRAPERAAAAFAVAAIVGLSLLRLGNALEDTAAFLCLIRYRAGNWPAPLDDHMRLFLELPLGWCRLAAIFEAHGVLFEALLGAVIVARFLIGVSVYALAASAGARGAARLGAVVLVLHALPLTIAHYRLLPAEGLPAFVVAMPAVFLALAAALAGRPVAAGALLGAAALVHPPQALVSTPSVLAALVAATPTGERLKAAARMLAVCGLLALPQAATVLSRNTGDLDLPREQSYALARATVWPHVFLPAWTSDEASRLLWVTAALLVFLGSREPRARALAAAGATGLAVCLAGQAVAEIELLPVVALKACFGRAGIPALASVLVLTAMGAAADLTGTGEERGRWSRCGFAFMAAGLLESETVAAAGVALLAIALVAQGKRVLGYAALPLALGYMGRLGPEHDEPARGLLLAAALLVLGEIARRRPRPYLYAASGLLASVLVHHVTLWPPVLRWAVVSAAPHASGSAERRDLGTFIDANLPRDALLLVPPEERILPYFAGRNVVALASWGTFAIWNLQRGSQEIARLERIGYRFGDPARELAYHAWTTERILAAARAEGATHVVLDRQLGGPSLGQPLYANARFELYAVPPR